LRTHRPGTWLVVERHGALYFGSMAERRVRSPGAGITAEFIRKLDPARERCWMRRRTAAPGCIFLVAARAAPPDCACCWWSPRRVASAGGMLVAECVRFARAAGYERIVLWTQENLAAAAICTSGGFTRTARESHHSFDTIWSPRPGGSSCGMFRTTYCLVSTAKR